MISVTDIIYLLKNTPDNGNCLIPGHSFKILQHDESRLLDPYTADIKRIHTKQKRPRADNYNIGLILIENPIKARLL